MKNEILICGDFMPGGVLYQQDSFADVKVVKLLKSHRYVVATLECALSENDDYLSVSSSEKAVPKVVIRKEDLDRLYAMNVNVVSLANNHVFDLGTDSFDRLIQELTEHNTLFFGAGHNIDEASKPVVISENNQTVAFYGCCMEGIPPSRLVEATENQPGIWKASIQELTSTLKSARGKYDYIFVMPHGGQEYKSLPMRECIEMSKQMVDAGADGVFWSHAHCLQPKMLYKKHPIYFGLGSLLFPDVYIYPPRSIFYPDEDFDYSQIEYCTNFPKKVHKPTMAIWAKSSRTGLGVSLSLKNGFSSISNLFMLNQNNVLKEASGSKAFRNAFSLWLKSMLFVLPTSMYGKFRKVIYKNRDK